LGGGDLEPGATRFVLGICGPPACAADDFDFKEGGGFVVARRVVQRAVYEDYAVRFRLRGRGPANDLEIKLVDATGLNVWRHMIKNLRPPARWKNMKIDSHEMEFAWVRQAEACSRS
jgi:hypothetical protein